MPVPQFVAGQLLSAAALQQLGDEDDTWVPTLEASTTNPTLGGSPVQWSKVQLNGNLVNLWWALRFGSSASGGSGTYQVPLPAAYPIAAGFYDTGVGELRLLDDNLAATATAMAFIDPTGQYIYGRDHADAALITNTNPWTWTDNDWHHGHVTYFTDFGA